MNRRHHLPMKWAALLVALTLVVIPQRLLHAQSPEPVKIRVEVTDSGFNPESIDLEQGQLVELTFVWAHKAYLQEEHIMVLEGYRLEWDKITSQQKEATLWFVAEKPGTFTFKCDLDCEVHSYLQRGSIKIKRTAAGVDGGAAALTPTTLTVTPSSWTTEGDTVILTAVLKDAKGAAVPKAELLFYVDAEFAGAEGKMGVGKAKTDANGVAFFDYKPTLSAQKQPITARFEGMGVYDESQQVVEIQEVGVPPSAYTQPPIGLESIRHWAPVALGLTILSVWAVFGYVLLHAVGMVRARPRSEPMSHAKLTFVRGFENERGGTHGK